MAELDEATIVSELVIATGEAATVAVPDWDYAVSTRVYPEAGVATWEIVAYDDKGGRRIDLFDHQEIDQKLNRVSRELFEVQAADWRGMKCSVARSGHFRIDYEYDAAAALRWAGAYFGGSPPEKLVRELWPEGL